MGNAYLAEFYRIHEYRLGNLSFKNVKISKNCKIFSMFYHKTAFYVYHSQNLSKNSRNFGSGFFPDFPDLVFFRKKIVRGLARGQTIDHFITYIYIVLILYKTACWSMLEQANWQKTT